MKSDLSRSLSSAHPAFHFLVDRRVLGKKRNSLRQKDDLVRVAGQGENIQVGELEVHVMSAIHRHDYPLPGAFNVLLVGSMSPQVYVRTGLRPHRFTSPQVYVPTGRYQYVSFAEKSCDVNMTVAREIVVPKDGKHKVAVCIKVVYGDPDPERLVEWLEFSRLVGVDVVQMFYHSVNISQRGLDVLQYYNSTGLVSLYPLTIAFKKGQPPRGFQSEVSQAFMDACVSLNDCVHRLYRYDFVIVMDLDELLLPSPPYNTLPELFQIYYRSLDSSSLATTREQKANVQMAKQRVQKFSPDACHVDPQQA
ncbi:hypothetical protein BaRGS_00010783 [Batillaria attramentaria]|uniref:Glycosyltransferase family 92 protein n=1 Tax=Batillaria attramentaria TaxID=370345 RepID=A0ABD0LEC3_9CAEN